MDAEDFIDRIPWRCFFCDFITTDRAEAEAHFGDADEAEPLCKWWTSATEDQRLATLQGIQQELNAERDLNARLQTKVEALEYQVESQESVIKSYKPFRGCRSIHDVFCLYDSMEGRALAAEEALKEASNAIQTVPEVRLSGETQAP